MSTAAYILTSVVYIPDLPGMGRGGGRCTSAATRPCVDLQSDQVTVGHGCEGMRRPVAGGQVSSRSDPRAPEGAHLHRAIAPARAVLFDFDFTLADSSEGVVVCMKSRAGPAWGSLRAPADAIRRTIGLDLHTALRILAGEEWRSREEEFFEHFVRKADEVMVASTSFLPGAAPGAPDTSRNRLPRRGGDEPSTGTVSRTCWSGTGSGGLWTSSSGSTMCRVPNLLRMGWCGRRGRWGSRLATASTWGIRRWDAMAARAAGMGFVAVLSGTTGGRYLPGIPRGRCWAGWGRFWSHRTIRAPGVHRDRSPADSQKAGHRLPEPSGPSSRPGNPGERGPDEQRLGPRNLEEYPQTVGTSRRKTTP